MTACFSSACRAWWERGTPWDRLVQKWKSPLPSDKTCSVALRGSVTGQSGPRSSVVSLYKGTGSTSEMGPLREECGPTPDKQLCPGLTSHWYVGPTPGVQVPMFRMDVVGHPLCVFRRLPQGVPGAQEPFLHRMTGRTRGGASRGGRFPTFRNMSLVSGPTQSLGTTPPAERHLSGKTLSETSFPSKRRATPKGHFRVTAARHVSPPVPITAPVLRSLHGPHQVWWTQRPSQEWASSVAVPVPRARMRRPLASALLPVLCS